MPVENIVAQHHRTGRTVQKFLSYDEGLSQSFRPRLLRILYADAPRATAFQQHPEIRQIMRRGNNQNVANTGQHQH
ncbi:hypothetical protein SDC9_152687 [bioreactor metagenome]|uniref:Uncharacterized protein n=1 Tax=bioreactor metagenome TaxID=1076179 RepID=A0A645EUA9_9ZZZZ